jgi:hypothetical protein
LSPAEERTLDRHLAKIVAISPVARQPARKPP